MKTKYIFISVVALLFIVAIMFLMSKNAKLIEQQAVNKHNTEEARADAEFLRQQITGYNAINDSLVLRVSQIERSRAGIADRYLRLKKEYEAERERIEELPDDSAAAIFLDRAELTEVPVSKIDSMYLVPVEAIGFYNIMSVDFDHCINVSRLQQDENRLLVSQIGTMYKALDIKDITISDLNKIIASDSIIITSHEATIKAQKKQLRRAKTKGVIAVTVGAALGVLCIVL